MKQDEISKLYPYELRAANLGTCYNAISREIMKDSMAFDLGKLSHENLIARAKATSHTQFQATTSNTSAMGDSFFGLNTKISAGFPAFRGSIGFNMASALATSSNQKSFTAYLKNEVKGGDIRVLITSLSPETLYKCMTDDFRKYYEQVVTAKPKDRFKALKEFTARFGHGVIYKLDLISSAYAKLKITFKEDAKSSSTKYGTSIGVGVKGVEVSGAADWGKSRKNAFASSKLEVVSDVNPHNAPAGKWANKLLEVAMEKSFKIFDSSANFTKLPQPETPKLPELPKPVKPEEKVKPAAKKISEKEKTKLKKELLAENKKNDGPRAEKMSDKAYEKEPEDFKGAAIGEALRKLFALEDDDDDEISFSESATTAYSSGQAPTNHSTDLLGEFMPCGFETIPWVKLFPDLAVDVPQSWTAMNTAKLCLFVYSRMQFQQYIEFLRDVPSHIHGLTNIRTEAAKFEKIMENFVSKDVKFAYSDPLFNEMKLKKLITDFKKRLKKDLPGLIKVYNVFFQHHDFFRQIPFGFFGYTQYQARGSFAPRSICNPSIKNAGDLNYRTEKTRSLSKMLKDCIRLYPVITKEGAFKLIWFKDSWQELLNIYMRMNPEYTRGTYYCTESSKGERHPFEWSTLDDFLKKTKYDKSKNTSSFKHKFIIRTALRGSDKFEVGDLRVFENDVDLRGISYGDFSYNEPNLEIRGIPMFSDYPFDNVKRILNPLKTP